MDNELVWQDRKRVWCALPWTFTKYELSREKLIIKSGCFTQHQDEVRLYRILDLSLTRIRPWHDCVQFRGQDDEKF